MKMKFLAIFFVVTIIGLSSSQFAEQPEEAESSLERSLRLSNEQESLKTTKSADEMNGEEVEEKIQKRLFRTKSVTRYNFVKGNFEDAYRLFTSYRPFHIKKFTKNGNIVKYTGMRGWFKTFTLLRLPTYFGNALLTYTKTKGDTNHVLKILFHN